MTIRETPCACTPRPDVGTACAVNRHDLRPITTVIEDEFGRAELQAPMLQVLRRGRHGTDASLPRQAEPGRPATIPSPGVAHDPLTARQGQDPLRSRPLDHRTGGRLLSMINILFLAANLRIRRWALRLEHASGCSSGEYSAHFELIAEHVVRVDLLPELCCRHRPHDRSFLRPRQPSAARSF